MKIEDADFFQGHDRPGVDDIKRFSALTLQKKLARLFVHRKSNGFNLIDK
jgi:hypothetical protein